MTNYVSNFFLDVWELLEYIGIYDPIGKFVVYFDNLLTFLNKHYTNELCEQIWLLTYLHLAFSIHL